MANEKPYTYYDSISELGNKDIKDLVKFESTKNNVKEPVVSSKKKVFNPLSLLLLDPIMAPQAWARKIQYNKKIKEGRLDDVTDAERLQFESKADPNRGIFSGSLNPKNMIPMDKKSEVDLTADIATGAVTGLPLGAKAMLELLTIGADISSGKINDKFGTTLPEEYTAKLDKITRKFLDATGEPETLAGEITQLGTQFAIPMKITSSIIGNIPKLKPFISKIPGMKKVMGVMSATGSKIVNKNRFIKGGANLAQKMGTSGLALGASDFIGSGGERRLDPIFFERTNEEGKTGRELAAARLSNKIKFGKEGALIGGLFPLLGPVFSTATKGIGYGVGISYDTIGRVINPLVTAVTKVAALDPIIIPSLIKGVRDNADLIFNQFGTRVALTLQGRGKQIFRQLPEYKKWKRFTVDSTDELKVGLKKFDNLLSYIRSGGKNTDEAFFIKGSAKREIRASSKKIQDLLLSIENKSYDLAKGFETIYNTKKTSPALMNQYADEVLEFLEGKRKLNNLPEIMQNTARLLKEELKQMNTLYNKYIPDGKGISSILNGGTKSYVKKSFAFLNNPNRSIPEDGPIFKNAANLVKKLILRDKNLQDEAKIFSENTLVTRIKNEVGGLRAALSTVKSGKGEGILRKSKLTEGEAINEYANVMVRQILNLGKVDNKNPFEILRRVGERLNLDDFLNKGENLPDAIAKLLGQERNLKNNVLFTTSSMMTAIANKQMYDTLARIMLKQGQVFETQAAARAVKEGAQIVQIGKLDGMQGLKSEFSGLWTDVETMKVLTSNRGPLDFLAEIPLWNNYLKFKGGVQWGKTVGSPATTSRNFITAADFAMQRGLIGGRSSVTNAVKMQVDDIYNSGKLSGTAEEKLLANIDEGIKYGALDENIVVTELRELLAATQKGTKINSLDTLIKATGDMKIIELMGKVYAGGDHVWKWYGYNWYKSFLTDYAKKDMSRMATWFKKIAGRELDLLNNDGTEKTLEEAIKEASAYYVRNTMPTYSKVPPLIKGVRNLPLGNFVAFPAEQIRGTFNVLNISTKEILSGDPILREMGYRGLLGSFVTTGAKGIAIQKIYGALTGLSSDVMKEYQRNLTAGYQENSQLVALTKAVKGKFRMVDLSTVLPYDFVNRPFRALNNALEKKELNQENTTDFLFGLMFGEGGPMRELFDPFVSTPIGNEAYQAVINGKTKTGKQIWGELNSPEEKWDKSVAYLAETLEPGALTSMRQAYSALTGTEYKGRVYDMKDVLMGLFTGVKPYEIDLNKNIDFIVNDYTQIRDKAFDGSAMYKTTTYGSAIPEEFIRIQRNIWLEQKRIYEAFKTAEKFGVSTGTLKKELRSRNVSWVNISKILRGNMSPLSYSQPRFEDKIKILKKNDKDNNFRKERKINKDSFYPKRDLDKIIRKLQRQKLDEPFIFDEFSAPTIPFNKFSLSSEEPTPSVNPTSKIQAPPLGDTPMPVKMAQNTQGTNSITNLTPTQEALLSPTEKVIASRT